MWIYDKNYPMKKIPSLYDTFEIFAIFENLPILEIFNANMTIIIAIFFAIFDENDVLYILVEFGNDRISPCESAQKWTNWRPRVILQIFFQFWIQIRNLR